MIIKYAAECNVCKTELPVGSQAEGFKNSYSGKWFFLCGDCHARAGSGHSARKIIEAWYYQYDDNFGGPLCDADHEDYHILENLGVSL